MYPVLLTRAEDYRIRRLTYLVENRVWVVAPHPCGQDAIEALRCFTFYDLDFLRLHRYDLGSLPRTVPTLDSLGTLP